MEKTKAAIFAGGVLLAGDSESPSNGGRRLCILRLCILTGEKDTPMVIKVMA